MNQENDSQTFCKYGENCYQKNPMHHKRYKHPYKVGKESEQESSTPPPVKKCRLDEPCDTDAPIVKEQLTQNISNENDLSDDPPEFDSDNELITDFPQTNEEKIKRMFMVDMPRDFYDFWDFCKSLNNEGPEDSLSSIGLELVGPFHVLSGKLSGHHHKRLYEYLCYWRFYYDPPEFQTILFGSHNEYHIGYFRDDPSEDPVFLASMSALKPGIIQPMKEDLFSSIHSYVNSVACQAVEEAKSSFLNKLKAFISERNYSLNDGPSVRLKARKKAVVSSAFHGAGIVVPVDKKNDVGYREIPETKASLKRIMKAIDEAPTKAKKDQHFETLHELLTNVQFANDEGDFGMGLELGLDLFTYGSKDFHSSILHLLTVAYDLLRRGPFAKIIKAHLKNRRKGSKLGFLESRLDSSLS